MDPNTAQPSQSVNQKTPPINEPQFLSKHFSFTRILLILLITLISAFLFGTIGYFIGKYSSSQSSDIQYTFTKSQPIKPSPTFISITPSVSPSQTPAETSGLSGIDSSTPQDFATYITAFYKQKQASCDIEEISVDNSKIIRDSFAETQEGCGTGWIGFYAKVNGSWVEAFTAQGTPTCATVNKYFYTKELIPDCTVNPQISPIPNTNP